MTPDPTLATPASLPDPSAVGRTAARVEGRLALSQTAVAAACLMVGAIWLVSAWALLNIGIFGAGLGGSVVADRLVVAVGTLLLVALPLVMLWRLHRARATVLDAQGVHQPGLRGAKLLPWGRVVRIELHHGQGLCLRGDGALQVLIPLSLCRHPMQVTAYVLDRLREHKRL